MTRYEKEVILYRLWQAIGYYQTRRATSREMVHDLLLLADDTEVIEKKTRNLVWSLVLRIHNGGKADPLSAFEAATGFNKEKGEEVFGKILSRSMKRA